MDALERKKSLNHAHTVSQSERERETRETSVGYITFRSLVKFVDCGFCGSWARKLLAHFLRGSELWHESEESGSRERGSRPVWERAIFSHFWLIFVIWLQNWAIWFMLLLFFSNRVGSAHSFIRPFIQAPSAPTFDHIIIVELFTKRAPEIEREKYLKK